MSLINMVKASVEKRIIDTSWDYRNQNTKSLTHGFHTYPAMMIPQIARRLIEEYGKDAKTVLDPFVGSGTALVESKVKPHIKTAIGVDLNPLAILLSKSKTTPIESKILLRQFNDIMEEAQSDFLKYQNGSLKIEIPDFHNIDFWFKPKSKTALALLKNRISKIKDQDIRDFFLTVFSETVRKASNTRSGEFKLYRVSEDKLKTHNPSVFDIFREKAVSNIKSMEDFYTQSKSCKIKVLNEDTRNLKSIPSNSVDLIVTSPPYGDSRTTVAYGQFSRLALEWLGFESEEVRRLDNESLGGKPTKHLEFELGSSTLIETIEYIGKIDEKRARDVLSFYVDFEDCIKELNRVCKSGAHLCFVVGNRTVKGLQIPTDLIFVELFMKYGYKHHKTIVRNIPTKRMPKKNSPTNEKGKLSSTMNEEYIIILEKL